MQSWVIYEQASLTRTLRSDFKAKTDDHRCKYLKNLIKKGSIGGGQGYLEIPNASVSVTAKQQRHTKIYTYQTEDKIVVKILNANCIYFRRLMSCINGITTNNMMTRRCNFFHPLHCH